MTLNSVKSLLCLRCSSFLSLQSCDHRRTSGSPQQQGYSSGTGTSDARQGILLNCNQGQKNYYQQPEILLTTIRNTAIKSGQDILLPMNRKMLSKNRNTAIKERFLATKGQKYCYQKREILLSKTKIFPFKKQTRNIATKDRNKAIKVQKYCCKIQKLMMYLQM